MQLIMKDKRNFVLRCYPGFLGALAISISLFTHGARADDSSPGCTLAGPPIQVFNLDVPEISPTLKIGESITGGPVSFRQINVANCVVAHSTLTNEVSETLGYQINAKRESVGMYAGKQTFATNVPGIGIQIGNANKVTPTPANGGDQLKPDWIVFGDHTEGGFSYSNYSESVSAVFYTTWSINLIKTADVIGSGSLYGVYSSISPNTEVTPDNVSSVTVNLALNGVIQPSGCIITNGQNLNIVLDDVEKKNLPSVGSSWGESSPENIQLTCNKGANVYITFTGDKSEDTSDASVLQNNGSAKGIGIQLLNNKGDIYSLNEKISAITDADVSATIPVSARYIRTGDLSAGTVQASATYTLNYE